MRAVVRYTTAVLLGRHCLIHDADLDDGKFGRAEGIDLDRTLIGWAKLGVSDEELLRRGMELNS
jgi:hypothetical protein